MSFEEIRRIVNEARSMGCRSWTISGGEPMVHPDFEAVFDYITRNSVSYSLNTNGTLITQAIAQLLKRRGRKMVALYGATAEVHDAITRNPGSYEAALRGMAYLREAGANFIVQIVPMRDNYHQYDQMVNLAQTLSPEYRLGASWLYGSASGNPKRNREIFQQRLDPATVVALDPPDLFYEESVQAGQIQEQLPNCLNPSQDDRLFSACIDCRRDFHIDPYGLMTFCCYVKDPALRYDLRQGSFQEAWESFIPSLADQVHGGTEYLENCVICELRADCKWCAVFSYLEQGRFSAPVPYLCEVARQNRQYKENWRKDHRRYFSIAGITVQVDSQLPLNNDSFGTNLKKFQVAGPGDDIVSIYHHAFLPDLPGGEFEHEVYHRPPWVIRQHGRSWIYYRIMNPGEAEPELCVVAVFNAEHSRGRIYNDNPERFNRGNLHSLTGFSTDQILLARVLADRQACYLHAAGMILDGQGFLFVGHSDAGKSTIVTQLKSEGEILCDDRMIVRRWPEGFKIHGTWSHGDMPDVSPASASLRAIFLLEQAAENRLIPIVDRREVVRNLPFFVIKPLVTTDWWEKTLDLVGQIAREVPVYVLQFDRSGQVKVLLNQLLF